jgi:tetratricopeptide (TPR) repeat protein
MLTAFVGLLAAAAQVPLYYKMRPRRSPPPRPAMIPRPLAEFTGRLDDLQALRDRYASQAAARSTGPILLFIHGKPGVGKSALARQLANELIPDFPHGRLYANLGSGGEARPAGEILGEFLVALGRQARGKARREGRFRSATAQLRLLIVLDAARNADQVRKLLPNGIGCCVIVTSRRTLGPDFDVTSHRLDIPGTNDAIEILSKFSQADWRHQPESAAKIVSTCGRLPIALASAGGLITQRPYSLREVSERLDDATVVLSLLTHDGKSIAERIASEYENLTDRERRAFRLLTLVDSATFIPWVLRPLLDVDITEAENLMAQLAEAELLEVAGPESPLGPDSPLGVARYRFHPLFRLFALGRLAVEDDPVERQAARERLDSAYLELITRVLIHLDPDLPGSAGIQPPMPRWLSSGSTLPARIAELPSHWVRADYKNWLRAAIAAHGRGNWKLCWRISIFLGGPVPEHAEITVCRNAFKLAEDAASRDHYPPAVVKVLLAKGTFLFALERYAEALATLDRAARQISELKSDPAHEVSATGLDAVRHRTIAEGWVQLAAYARAETEINAALALARLAGNDDEVERALILQDENTPRLRLDHKRAVHTRAAASFRSDDSLWFHDQLIKSDSALRDRDWPHAEEHLKNALTQNYGDERRTANIRYRLARLRLYQYRSTGSTVQRARYARESVGFASAALISFREMENNMGAVRARCLLARGLALTGQFAGADEELHIAESELNIGAQGQEDISHPLEARLRFAKGEVLLQQRKYGEARQVLSEAVTLFAEEKDRRSQVEALLLRGHAERAEGQHANANNTLWAVAAAFMCSGDEAGVAFALEQLALTAEEMRQFATAVELRILAQNGSAKRFSPSVAFSLARSLYSPRGVHPPKPATIYDRDIHLPV